MNILGNYDPERIARALDRALARALEQEELEGPRIYDLAVDQIVILSDQHKGARDGADDFQGSEAAYRAALEYYQRMGYTLLVLGDVEELWEERPGPVLDVYEEIIQQEASFHQKGRYLRVWGNHDDNWRYPDQVEKFLVPVYGGEPLVVRETLLYRVMDQGEKLGDLLLLHGHQGTLDSDVLADFSRWIVRYIWRPFQRLTHLRTNTPATDWKLGHAHNIAMYQWTETQRQLLLLAGHTHRPVFESKIEPTQIEREKDAMRELVRRQPDDRQIRQKLEDLQKELEYVQEEALPKTESMGSTGERAVVQRKPSYFNSGCCCYANGDITGIELVGGEIRLIRWPDDQGEMRRQVLARGDLREIFKAT